MSYFSEESQSNLVDLSPRYGEYEHLYDTLSLRSFEIQKSGICFLVSIAYGNSRVPKGITVS